MPDLISHPSINFEPSRFDDVDDVDDRRVAFILAKAKKVSKSILQRIREKKRELRKKENYAGYIEINLKLCYNRDNNNGSLMKGSFSEKIFSL